MRKILRGLISKESVGVLVTTDSFKSDIDNEIFICFLKVNELRDMLGNVQEFSESVALRIEARLHHIFGCVEEFEELFDDKRTAITKPNRNILQKSSESTSYHKWSFTFSGDSKGLSVTAFIERMEEYKIAKNVSDSALKNSIIELLQGSDLIWYRNPPLQQNGGHYTHGKDIDEPPQRNVSRTSDTRLSLGIPEGSRLPTEAELHDLKAAICKEIEAISLIMTR
ncbi:hypothetical protein FQA39_LY10187 [Lamprigera yunnana]|nr:hypothetical protein FQA39_LY10187 [Lamprigera yunnana]